MQSNSLHVILVRHGQTAWNAAGRWMGHADPPLDETGRRQAQALGPALARFLAPQPP